VLPGCLNMPAGSRNRTRNGPASFSEKRRPRIRLRRRPAHFGIQPSPVSQGNGNARAELSRTERRGVADTAGRTPPPPGMGIGAGARGVVGHVCVCGRPPVHGAPLTNPGFTLAVNGQPLVDFDTAKTQTLWRGRTVSPRSCMCRAMSSPRGARRPACFTSLFPRRICAGPPCRLEVRSRGSDNRRYFNLTRIPIFSTDHGRNLSSLNASRCAFREGIL
jgi:hypothetical protein